MSDTSFESCTTPRAVTRKGDALEARFDSELEHWVPLEEIASLVSVGGPDTNVEETELRDLLLKAADRLAPAQQRAFLASVEAWSVNEMADEFGVSPTSVRNALTDAEFNVRSKLESPLRISLLEYYKSGPGEP